MFFETDPVERYKKGRKCMSESKSDVPDVYYVDEGGDGVGFDEVLDTFRSYKPIRNLDWAPGVYAVLNKDNRTITMYYEDKETDSLDHSNTLECISINDLISDKWIIVYQCRKEF